MKLTNTHLKLQSFNVVDIDEILNKKGQFHSFQVQFYFSGFNLPLTSEISSYHLYLWRQRGIKRLKVFFVNSYASDLPILVILNAWPSK